MDILIRHLLRHRGRWLLVLTAISRAHALGRGRDWVAFHRIGHNDECAPCRRLDRQAKSSSIIKSVPSLRSWRCKGHIPLLMEWSVANMIVRLYFRGDKI